MRDLIRPISDFPAREINVSPSGDVPEIDEDIEEREALVITEDSDEKFISGGTNQPISPQKATSLATS